MAEAGSFRWGRVAAYVAAAVGLGALAASAPAPGPLGWVIIAVVLLSVGLMHLASGLLDFRRITFPSFWYIMYLATVLIPGLLVAADRPGPIADRFLLGILSTLVMVPAGVGLVAWLTGTGRGAATRYFQAPVESAEPSAPARALYWSAVGLAALLTLIYITEVDTIPLFYLLRNPGATAEVVLLREDAFKLLDSPFLYWYDVLRRMGFPLLTAMAMGWYLVGRRAYWFRATIAVGMLGVFFASLSLAKAPVALLILICCFTWYVHRGGRVRPSQVLLGAALVLGFPLIVLLGLAQRSDVTVWILIEAIFRRLFLLPAEILYAYFELFPDHLPFLHGRSIGRVAWLMGTPSFDLANYAFNFLYPGGVDSGSAPASFPGYFYADFGMPGVLVGGLGAGAVMQGIHVYFLRHSKTVLAVAGYAFMYWAFWQVNLAAFPQTMLSGGVLFVLAAVVLFELGTDLLTRYGRARLPSSSTTDP